LAAVIEALVGASMAEGAEPIEFLERLAKSPPASQPASRPAGLSGQTRPTTQPAATLPAGPFHVSAVRSGRHGWIELSSGRRIRGRIWTTPGKPLRVFVPSEKRYRDVPLAAIRRVSARVEWERLQDEWRWRHAGSDEKVFTGHKYPVRMLSYRFELVGGRVICGFVAAPIWVRGDDGRVRRFVLHKRQKGPVDTTLGDLVYVKEVVFCGAGGDARPTRIKGGSASRPTPDTPEVESVGRHRTRR